MRAAGLRIGFGARGDAGTAMREGWSSPEDGFTWATGPRAVLHLERVPDGASHVIVSATPFVRPPHLIAQALEVFAHDGAPLGRVVLSDPAVVAFVLPPSDDPSLTLTFAQPDAARPSDFEPGADTRRLGFAFAQVGVVVSADRLFAEPLRLDAPVTAQTAAARTGLTHAELVARFEGVGDNCEFGLAQRRAGAEPLGLLRFASIKAPDLVRGLESGFPGLGEPGGVSVRAHPGAGGRAEWMVHEPAYGLQYHTFIFEGDAPVGRVLADEARRLTYLRRRLLEDCADARKLFVLKRNERLDVAEVLPVLFALRARGDNALLYLVPADAAHPPGTVVALSRDLFRGHAARFAPGDNAHDLDLDTWLAVCANAWLLSTSLRGDRYDR